MANGQIRFGVGFDVDKSGLQSTLKDIESIKTKLGSISASASFGDKMNKELQEAGKTASQLSDILSKSFNTNLGTINVTKFKTELAKTGMTISDVRQKLSGAGTEGKAAFAQVGSALLSTNVQLKQSNKLLDEMATTMANTVKWGVTSSIFNNISSSVQDAYHYVKQLDSSLNDIRIVTDKSAESMAKFAVQANTAAKNLGASTRDYTDASLIYYQQGLSDKEAAARAETTLKAANVTGQNTVEVSEQLTAVWNGYKVSAQEAELYVDKLAAVAATTASDLEELSTGMSKVASAASIMGVDIDQLNAQLATIVSVTKEAPESIGTALKTVYARMSDIKSGLDGETTLDEYTQQMADMGVHVLDANGNLRDMGDVVEEIGGKWSSMTREQQTSLAQTIAGTRQYSRMMALFDNWDMYTDALNTSAEAAGTLQHQQDIYMETTEAHLQQLKTSAEDIYDTLIKPEEINDVIDIFRIGTDVLGTFFDAFGGGVKSMVAGAAVMSSVFSKQIGQGLISLQTSKSQAQNNKDLADVKKDAILKQWEGKGESVSGSDAAKVAGYEKQSQLAQDILEVENGITEEQYQQMTALQVELGALAEEKELIQQNLIAENEKLGINKELTLALQEGGDALENYNSQLLNIQINLGDAKEELENLNQKNKELLEWQKKIQEMDRMSPQALKKEKKALSKSDEGKALIDFYEDHGSNAQKAIKKDIEKNNKKLKEQEETVKNITKHVNEQEQAYDNIIKAQEKRKNIEDQETEKQAGFDQMKTEAEKATLLQNRVDLLTNSLSMLTMTWGAFQSLGSILSDEDLTIGEKLGQTIMTLGTAIPSLIYSYQSLSKVLGENVTIESILNGLLGENTGETIINTGATAANAAAEKAQSKAKGEGAISEDLDTVGTKKNTLETIKNTAATLLEGGKKGGTKAISGIAGGLQKVWGILGKFAGPLVLIGGLIASISFATKQWQKDQEENAKASAAQAAAQDEVIQKTNEEYNKIKELNNAYDELKEQYKNNEISTGELRLQIVDLLQQHGLEKEAVEAKTASYEELLEIMNKINGISMGDVIAENEKGIEAQKSKIKTDIWANQVEGSSRDSFFGLGEQTIDVGTISGLDDLSDILKDYEINFDLAGHVNLDDLTKVLVEDGNAFISALSNSTSESATKLLEIVSTQQESIDAASGYRNTLNEVKVEKIQEEVYGDYEKKGGFENIEEYNKAVTKMADSLQSEGIVETYNEALEKARELLSVQDDLAANIYGWESVAGTTKLNFADELEQDFYNSAETIDKIINEMGLSMEELAIYDLSELANLTDVSDEDAKALSQAFERYKLAVGDASLTYQDFYNQISKKNPLEGLWLEDETTKAKTQDLFKYALESGKEDLLNYFTEADWDAILALDTAEERMALFQKLMTSHLEELKEDSSSTLAPNFNQLTTSLLNQGAYINADNVGDFSEYNKLVSNAELLKILVPDLTDEMTTLTDKSKAGTEEWNRALQEVQQTMAAMAEDPTNDGVFSKEDAQNLNITESGLKEELLAGNIDTDAYDQKFAGAINYEMELQGLNAEEVRDYADSLQDVAKSSDEVANGLAEDEQAALKVAKANSRMNKGIETLAKNFDDIRDKIEDNEEGSQEWAEGLKELRGGMGDLLNIDGDALSQEFLTSAENLNLMKEASQGSAEAIEQLRAKAAIDIVQNTEVFLNGDEETRARLNQLNAEITNFSAENDLEIGAHVDDSQFIAACNEMIAASGMTAEQVGNYFKAMGYDANVKTVEQPTTSKIPVVSYQVEGDLENGGMSMIPDVTMQDVQTTVNVPVVESLTYTGSAGGTVNSSAKKGSGGGGGGGGAKPKTASREKQKFKPNLDPFHEVNEQLDLMAQKLERLSKKQEKAFGKDLIKNLQEQNKVLESQNEKLKEKIKITDQEIAKDKNKLKNFKINGKKLSKIEKVKYNEDGSVANYDEVLSAAAADVEKLRKKYDNEAKKKYKEGSKKDEARKDLKEKLDKAKEEYSNLEELLNEHDEYIVNKEELLNQQQDNIDQMVQNNIEIFTIPIEIKLEVSNIKENYNNFLEEWNKITSEKPIQLEIDTIKDNANLAIGNIEHLTTMVTQTQAELAKIQKGESSDLFGKDEQAAYETLKEYTTKLQDELSKIPQYYEDAAAAVANAMGAVSDAMAEKISDMEFYSDSIQHMINVNEKLYGENKAAGKNKDYYKNLVAQSNALVTTLKGNADYWKSEMDSITDKNSEAYKIAKENYISATQDMQAALETTLENIQLQLEQNIKGLFIAFEEGLSPDNWNVDTMTSDWEMAVEESERYLNNIDKANQLKQLELKYQQAIDKSSSLSTQKELLALKQEELNVLKEQGKLTQYDIDRANKKLQLKLAEMALEEAQNNKSKMRLRRDSQGNYSYQYVADQDNIAEKQAAVDNLKAEMANDDFKHMKDVVSQYLGDESDFSERYAELAANGATDAELKEFQESYISRLVDQGGEFSKAWQYLTESTAAATGKDLSSMSEEEKLQMLKDNYGADIISSQALVFLNNLTGNLKTTEEATKYLNEALFTKIDAERTEAEEAKNRASAAAGYGENFEAMSTALNSINAEVTAFNTESDKTITNLKTQLDGVQSVFDIIKTFLNDEKVKAGLETLKSAIGTDTDANGNQVTSDGSLTAAGSDEQSGAVGDTSGTTNINETETGPDAKDSETTKQSNGKIDIGDVVTIKKEANTYTKKSKKNEFYTTKDSKKKVVKAKKDETYVVQAKPVEGKDGNNKTATFIKLGNKKWVKQGSIKGFDTGGYTGRWNSSEGRLAFLHQKELVLNAKDTENMLRMTKITRQMMRDMNPELLQRQYEEMTNSLKVANNKEWKIAKNQMLNELQALSTFKEEMAKKIVDMEATNYSFAEITQSIMNKMQEDIMAKYNFTIDKIKNQVAEFKHSQKEKDVIDQKVHIEATFPNVSHSREIEDAFNNLINIAAQRAYNTKRLK